ncbi:DUF167 domain-containing protein [Jiangella asiatica]|uniref:DUF167 domain-containing protein n=1 Tax=Jiangella asiatica TaxID=2530372 RepID=A0A4R5CK14_9ACTN|nr:DUF167 domain-containing protein [Jiangella asiatica]
MRGRTHCRTIGSKREGEHPGAPLDAVAEALGCRRREVTLITGATSRTKTVEVPDASASKLAALLREVD